MALAAIVLATSAAARAQVTDVVHLAPGEVPLRIVAGGKARTPADAVTITIPVAATAPTATAARAAALAAVARITTALLRVGVPAAAITSGQPAAALGFIGNEADDDDNPTTIAAAAAAQAASTQHKRQNSLTVKVLLDAPALLPRAEQALDAIDQPYGPPAGTLTDDRSARQAAAADAAGHARAEADAYAAALNMRVTRVLAVSDAPAVSDLTTGWTLYAMVQGLAPAATEVETRRRIQIDYALAPR